MKHLTGGVLLLLLAWPAARADDKPKGEPTPKARYDALVKEHQKAQQEFFSALRAASTPEEQQKKMAEASPALEKVLAKFVELAEKHPKDAVALDALQQVVSNGFVRGGPKGAKARAIELILRDHVASGRLGPLCQQVGNDFGVKNADLLRAILERNPDKGVQAEACLALAQHLQQQAEIAKRVADDADLAKRVEGLYGKETVEGMRKADVAKLKADGEAMFQQLGEKHLAAFKADRLVTLCQRLGFSSDKGSESLLRTLMERRDDRQVKGVACLTLAQVLKTRADETSEKDAKEADKLRKQAEGLFAQAAEKYGDVKMPFRGTVGDKAKGELYEIRHLAVGKPAPEVEGEDQDGKKFKLADYKGKVVLLDFWSQF
ncbi:MAG: hypothetical protein U0797_31030 [Gemmataceae bacterium]